jgi:uncharacterized protein (TIGR02594 family)
MEIALKEADKKVHELASRDGFVQELRNALLFERVLGSKLSPGVERPKPSLGVPQLPSVSRVVGHMEANSLQRANPEIDKYFDGLRTDPSLDRKRGRSYELSSTHANGDAAGITAWCAAFVNWCLKQSNSPSLGYGTASSWLRFGTPVASPVYGCITVIKPSHSTGSTTGHVAFYVGAVGDKVELLGGNQSDAVKKSRFPANWVLGYRWPTSINHYLLARPDRLA